MRGRETQPSNETEQEGKNNESDPIDVLHGRVVGRDELLLVRALLLSSYFAFIRLQNRQRP